MRLLSRFALVVLSVASLAYLRAEVATAQDGGCVWDPISGHCIITMPGGGQGNDGGGTEGGSDGGGTGGGDGDNSGGQPQVPPPDPGSGESEAICDWQTVTGEEAAAYRAAEGVSDDYIVQVCVDDNGENYRVLAPGEEGPTVTPEEVAQTYLAQAEARMVAPNASSSPPEGTPVIVSLPVFVEVTNWVDGFSVPGCVGAVCVELTATPTLTFDPGEPGALPVVCTPPGTRFNPDGGDPVEQASAPGACAYVYNERTGVGGRPGAWSATATVTWNVNWSSTINGAPGPSGSFPPMALSDTLDMVVNEVQTVVVDGGAE